MEVVSAIATHSSDVSGSLVAEDSSVWGTDRDAVEKDVFRQRAAGEGV